MARSQTEAVDLAEIERKIKAELLDLAHESEDVCDRLDVADNKADHLIAKADLRGVRARRESLKEALADVREEISERAEMEAEKKLDAHRDEWMNSPKH